MRAIKMKVALRDIRPSGTNPRQDFGDIGQLARSISATGGEPVNPVIVVEDGNVYRVVDGERRYRALCEIYGRDSDRPVPALVAQGMTDAEEMVAMVATDDKRQLSDAERARGVQQMMALGVDEERAALAAHTTRGRVRAARALAGSVPAGTQVTLEQMEAALALPEDRRDEVLSAGEGWRGVARRIAGGIERERLFAADRKVWEAAGVKVLEGVPGADVPWRHVGYASPGRAAKWIESHTSHSPLEAGTTVAPDAGYWRVMVPTVEKPGPTPEEAEAERLALRREEARMELLARAALWVADNDFDMPSAVADLAKGQRCAPWLGSKLCGALAGLAELGERDPEKLLIDRLAENVFKAAPPSRFECSIQLLETIERASELDLSVRPAADGFLDAARLLGRCGFDIGDEGRWLIGSLEEEMEGETDGE